MLLSLIRTKRLAITTNNLFCTLSQYKFNVTNYVLCSNPFGDQRKWIGLNCSAICVRNYTIGDKTDVEIERELFQLKRQMAAHHNHARYGEALDAAVELADRIKNIIGEQTTSYASSLNNVALMHKALGQNEEAMEHYVKALHLYQDLSGKESSSYATTLSNLGALYKSMAEASKGMDKMELLERATEALLDARNVRQKLLGSKHKETLGTNIHLAAVYKLKSSLNEAEALLRETLEISEVEYGSWDAMTALVLNDLGLLLKTSGKMDEVESLYKRSLEIRRKILGESHPITFVVMHNLAEFYLSTARDIEATQIQEEILALAEKPNNIEKSSFVTRENAKGFTTTEGIRVYRSSEKSSDL